jgi:hypothetical protein
MMPGDQRMTRRGQYARAYQRSAPLYTEFAKEFLLRHFSPAVVEALYANLPTYTRGPRKGMLKGYVHWLKCEVGGWYRGDGGHGYVMRPGSHKITVTLGNDPLGGYQLLVAEANCKDEDRIAFIKMALERYTGEAHAARNR